MENINGLVYAGIGSRDCPDWVLKTMTAFAEWFAINDCTLRSGGAEGCDTAFEIGCTKRNGKMEIYLPWYSFNNNKSNLIVSNPKAFKIAEKFHPAYNRLSEGAKKLQARNSHQVLGGDLNSPCDFVLCYTPSGNGSGGTGQAIRIARAYNIPVFDFGKYNSIFDIRVALREFLDNL